MKQVLNQTSEVNVPKGYRSYRIKGVDKVIVAKKGGPSSDAIKSKESYKELRNNQKEFGVASMMAKVLRQSLSDGMSAICESYVSGRLTAQFRNLAKLEEGATGTRSVVPSKHGHLLSGFEFNTDSPYKTIFDAKYFVKPGSRRGQVILHFPAFIPENAFEKPEGATNFKINARLVALSDHHFESTESSYVPKCPEFHGKFGSYESNMLPLLKIPTEPMTAQVSLPLKDELPDGVGLFLVMAVSFYHYDSGQFKHLAKDSGMQIHEVY